MLTSRPFISKNLSIFPNDKDIFLHSHRIITKITFNNGYTTTLLSIPNFANCPNTIKVWVFSSYFWDATLCSVVMTFDLEQFLSLFSLHDLDIFEEYKPVILQNVPSLGLPDVSLWVNSAYAFLESKCHRSNVVSVSRATHQVAHDILSYFFDFLINWQFLTESSIAMSANTDF